MGQLGHYDAQYKLTPALIKRWTENVFSDEGNDDDNTPTDAKSKTIKVGKGGSDVTLMITDTAGQERFRTVTSSYYRNAYAIILVFDISEEESFLDAAAWVEEGQRYAMDSLFVLVGNKLDLSDDRKVTTREAESYAEQEDMKFYMEVSAKTGDKVDQLFTEIANKLHQPKDKKDEEDDEGASEKKEKGKKGGKKKKGVDLHQKVESDKPRKRCII